MTNYTEYNPATIGGFMIKLNKYEPELATHWKIGTDSMITFGIGVFTSTK